MPFSASSWRKSLSARRVESPRCPPPRRRNWCATSRAGPAPVSRRVIGFVALYRAVLQAHVSIIFGGVGGCVGVVVMVPFFLLRFSRILICLHHFSSFILPRTGYIFILFHLFFFCCVSLLCSLSSCSYDISNVFLFVCFPLDKPRSTTCRTG